MHSYKNTSPGKSREYAKNNIGGPYEMPKPNFKGANSYEKIFEAECSRDKKSLNTKHYSRSKLNNK